MTCSTKRGMGILPNAQSGTSGGNRTHTLVKEADFESAASTNSATLAIYRSRSEKRRKHNEISEISKPNIRRVYGHREISGGQQFPWVGVNLG